MGTWSSFPRYKAAGARRFTFSPLTFLHGVVLRHGDRFNVMFVDDAAINLTVD